MGKEFARIIQPVHLAFDCNEIQSMCGEFTCSASTLPELATHHKTVAVSTENGERTEREEKLTSRRREGGSRWKHFPPTSSSTAQR